MGDNIWLEDRDGVRTPMQWSAAPNAGFSGADPATLYCPVLDDDTYGYRRLNVEAQRADPASLLNKMREMIRIRHAHPTFGRGEIQFLEPANRAVLAYLRADGHQTILCLNNLSSEPQTVDLDLAAWAGAQPVDLFTGQKAAPLTTHPQPFDLHRYEYRWLHLL